MLFNFEINENNSVLVFAEGASEPCLIQEINPNGNPWTSNKEAESWATNYIDRLEEKIQSDIETLESEKEAADAAVAAFEKPETPTTEEPAPTEG